MVKYLEKYELLERMEDRNIDAFGLEFKSGISVIVGENGSGKSTLLTILSEPEHGKKISNSKFHISEDANKNGVATKFFDTEKHNPRIKDLNYQSADTYRYSLLSRFKSHGQTLFPILEHMKKFNREIIFIDEPESGISPKNQIKLWKAFNAAVKNECQIILATHSYIFIKLAKEVFDMETKSWIKSEDYLPKLK